MLIFVSLHVVRTTIDDVLYGCQKSVSGPYCTVFMSVAHLMVFRTIFFYATDFAFLMICTFENEGKTMFLHKYSEALWFLIFVDME